MLGPESVPAAQQNQAAALAPTSFARLSAGLAVRYVLSSLRAQTDMAVRLTD